MNIDVKKLKKFFLQGEQKLVVLDGIDEAFVQGQTYAITGVSGTGKSTLLHILAGLDDPSEGVVTFGGQDIAKFSESQKDMFLNKSVGLVFQNPYLIAELSVLENVMVPGMIAEEDISTCKQRATLILKDVGLEEKIYSCPDSLSGGQQQRVALSRAIFNRPAFLLADEPTGSLDIKTGKSMVDLILKCCKRWKMGVIVSSHDSYVAQKMEHVFELSGGLLNKI